MSDINEIPVAPNTSLPKNGDFQGPLTFFKCQQFVNKWNLISTLHQYN